MKDFFPKTLHPLHIFEEDAVLYAADLEKARVVELSVVMAEMLKFAETRNDQEIQRTLGNSYADGDILEAFERFTALEREGLLFNRGEGLRTTFVTAGQRRKLLIAIPGIAIDSFFDIETLSAGTNMALSQMFHHLTNYVDLYFSGNQNRKLGERMYEVNMNVRDFKRLSRRIRETYFGILTLHQEHAQSVLSPSAYAEVDECYNDSDCDPGESCERVCNGTIKNGTCDGSWVNKCVKS